MTKFAGFMAAAVMTTLLAVPHEARAEIQYPWCAEFNGDQGNGGTNCGFVSREQCMASVHGVGGYCYENPAYVAPRPKKAPRPR